MPFSVFVLAFGAFSLITTEFGIIGILPQLAEAFDVSISAAGWLLGGFALTIAITGPWMTLAFSRFDRKLSLSLVLAIFAGSNLLSLFCESFGWLLFFRILPAFFHPVFWSFAMAAASSTVAEEDSGKAVSVIFAGLSAGTVLGVPMVSFVSVSHGWQAGFILFAGLNSVALIALLLFVPSFAATRRLTFRTQIWVLKKLKLWWSLAVLFLIMASTFCIYSYFAEYLAVAGGMEGSMIGLMLFIFGAAGFLGTLAAGRFVDKHLNRLVTGFVLILCLTFALIYGLAHVTPAVVALIIIWGTVHSTGFLLGQQLVNGSASEAPEFANSLFISLGNAGLTVGTFIGGVTIAETGARTLPLASIVLLALTATVYLAKPRDTLGVTDR
ncbi:MFS transporter [Nitratireductor sp.]|uniref:MFS transporter n=1 Tax=Nitratireductor sp. TaxID=1872084 RepID=UPI0025E22D92|nr:MFS transporter [Nitratireductor sp.]